MRRRLISSALILGLIGILSACSPPLIGTVGIERNTDGTLTVLVRMCRDSVDKLILHPINSFPTVSDGDPVNDSWESVPDIEVALTPPLTGAADVAFPVDEGALATDALYEVWAAGRQGNAFSGYFGASELAALRPGEVLAPTMGDDVDRDDGKSDVFVTVTPEKFEQRAEAFCS